MIPYCLCTRSDEDFHFLGAPGFRADEADCPSVFITAPYDMYFALFSDHMESGAGLP